jgi:hypothetical protein
MNHEKKLIKILKKQPVRFDFISLKPKKPNRTQTEKKSSQTRKNRTKLSQTSLNRFLS